MFVTIFGAANEVTGSCYLVETSSSRILVDCGMFQGSKKIEMQNRIPLPILSKKIDGVVLTHGHLDHCGRLPLLFKSGYTGPIWSTGATKDISELILEDAARIQEEDAKRYNKHHKLSGNRTRKPLFTINDVKSLYKQFRIVAYNTSMKIEPDISFQFVDAGHILGAASVELCLEEKGRKSILVFSGDLGQWNQPIVCDPCPIAKSDIIFLESTYGNRDHKNLTDTIAEFRQIITQAVAKQGKILIPSFAVGRTQQILYHLAEMFREKVVEPFPIYLDSPMAIAATELYEKYFSLMDKEAQFLYKSGTLKKDLLTLKICPTAEDSKALNSVKGPCIIIAGAGMCNAGRILHHLKHNLNDLHTSVLIVGYHAKGSLGRNLLEGAKTVRIYGETVHVKASIKGLGGFSAHAGQTDLLRWLEPMTKYSPKVFLTHGENYASRELAFQIKEKFNLDAHIPKLGETIEV